jgi:hypothetical protein
MTDEHPEPRGGSLTGQQDAEDKYQDLDTERTVAQAPANLVCG